jgi:hypothetical protein
MPNHHEKDLTAVLCEAANHSSRRLSATVAEGSGTVKLTAPFRRSRVMNLSRGLG